MAMYDFVKVLTSSYKLLYVEFLSKFKASLTPGFWVLVIPRGGHKVPTLNLRALNCCLTLKLGVCFQKYVLTSQEKKKIGPKLKKSVIF